MQIRLECKSATEFPCDMLAVNLFEGVKHPGGATGAVDKAMGGAISDLIASGEMTGKTGETAVINTFGKIPAKKIVCVGLGKNKGFNLESIRQAAASVIKAAKKAKAKKVATIIHGAGIGGMDPAEASVAIAQASMLSGYKFAGYKSKDDEPKSDIEELILIDYDCEKIEKAKKGVEKEQIIGDAVNLARDLVNGPSNMITPAVLAEKARELAKEFKLDCEILGRQDISKKGMKLIEAVSKGTPEEPKVIVLKYNGGGKEVYGLIGKGITFDSGGISIKTSTGMWEMKTDMAGAAAVMETVRVAAELKLKVNIIAVIPVMENMPSGEAYKPGDVIGSLAGKTVEIMSTDAEGRLILADAITYAKALGATKLIDIATLTGGCVVALGDVAAGILGNDQAMIDKIISLEDRTGEKLWQLPLYDEYKEYLKSDIADMKNCSDKGGKASTPSGATFLRDFVGDTPWVHIDIAGTALLDRSVAHMDKGATGFGVRTLSYLLSEISK